MGKGGPRIPVADLVAVAALGGIGFTVSLLMNELASPATRSCQRGHTRRLDRVGDRRTHRSGADLARPGTTARSARLARRQAMSREAARRYFLL